MVKKGGELDKHLAPTSEQPLSGNSEVLLEDIRSLIIEARSSLARSVNSELVLLYWRIGWRIGEELPAEGRADYGARVIELVSDKLTADYGRGFRRSNVFNMIRFAEIFDLKTVQTLSGQLSWSHFIELLNIKDPLQRDFYAEMHWSSVKTTIPP
jgi:hypothetical protein